MLILIRGVRNLTGGLIYFYGSVLYLVMTPHAQAMIPAAGTNIPSLSDLKGDGKPSLPAMDMRGRAAG